MICSKVRRKIKYAKLRGKIKEVFGTQEAFAAAIKMNTVSLSQRLNGNVDWKYAEIIASCNALGIPIENNAEFFYPES